MKELLLFFSFSLMYMISQAQSTAYQSNAFVDIGNIKASMTAHNEMWSDKNLGTATCEFPKNSGKHISYLGAIWIAGKNNGQLYVAANMYGQDGYDFWPGPIPASGMQNIDSSMANKWAKIWKVNRAEINSFLAQSTHSLSNTPTSILDWPARGNIYATDHFNQPLFPTPLGDYDREFAPFVDVNNDNVYDPLAGDYPDIIADQALWCVFNDARVHQQSSSQSMGIEIHCMAYAYGRNSLIDNVIFYNYKVHNRSNNQYDSLRLGFLADMDLGYAFDDYIGYDSTRNLGIVYNGTPVDGINGPDHYGLNIPQAGVQILEMPTMDCNQFAAAGSFTVFINSMSAPPIDLQKPSNKNEFYFYMTSRFKTGRRIMQIDIQGDTTFHKYVTFGNPANMNEWSECAGNSAPGDRKMVLSSTDATMPSGSQLSYSFALVASNPDTGNACPTTKGFAAIQEVADTAKKIFCNPLPISTALAVQNLSKKSLQIYPNPANYNLNIVLPETGKGIIQVFDHIGRLMIEKNTNNKNKEILNTSNLSHGMYMLRLQTNEGVYISNFVKE